MGKTKIKTIDDSAYEEAKKPAKKLGRRDELVEKLKAELDIKDETKLESTKAIGAVDSGAKQAPSEPSGEASGALRSSEPKSKSQKPVPKKIRSKKYQQVVKDLDRTKSYPVNEAVDMVKKLSYTKFNATLDISINTSQTGLAGYLSLPYVSGRKIRILAFGKGADQSGADIFGSDEIIEEINKQGKLDFDLVITTPEWMPKLARVAKILGPKGLMPNPKSGTITDDLKKAVDSFQSGKIGYRTEPKAPVIHLGLGKLNQPTEELSQNIKTLLSALGKSKVLKVSLSPTMGPSVRIDLASL